MLLSLPALCFALLSIVLARHSNRSELRSAALRAAVLLGLLVVAGTELLSLLGRLEAFWLGSLWLLVAVCIGLLAARSGSQWAWPRLPALEGVELASGVAVAVIVALTGLLALIGWPNEGDALWYHLPRIEHWIQNRSIAYYPTGVLNQLYYPPAAEYLILHARLLGGDPRLSQVVQWFAMVGSLCGVGLIARQLGGSRRGQWLSALFCAALPMGILQASSAQIDYVAAFWLVCLAHLLVATWARSWSPLEGVLIGASLGLATLTKATAYLYAAPLATLLLLTRPVGWPERLRGTALAGLVALALNLPLVGRNLELFGSPLGPTAGAPADAAGQVNATLGPGALASNLLRNAVLHLGTPVQPVNEALARGVGGVLRVFGLDPNDPATTWRPQIFPFQIPRAPGDEATAGNPVQLLLGLGALLTGLRLGLWRKNRLGGVYALAIVLGFVLLSALFRWRPFGSHWQLPLFVLAAPVVGVVLQGHVRLTAVAAAAMISWSLPYLLLSNGHPLLAPRGVLTAGAVEQTFRFDHGARTRDTVLAAAEQVRNRQCDQVGVLLPSYGVEYPFWVLLKSPDWAGRIEHVGVANVSARLAERWPPFRPCAVIAMAALSPPERLELPSGVYVSVWEQETGRVYLPEP